MKTLPVVLCCPEKHRTKTDRLVRYCRDLDGTEVTVLTVSEEEDREFIRTHPTNTFPQLQANSLRREALHFKGRSFIHLEVDSIPLKAGWAADLTEEYSRHGRPFMLSGDSHPPGDLVGGIGVYGPDTHFLIPVEVAKHGWDLWMVQHLKELVSFTSLIQHKYAVYPEGGLYASRDLTFPRDSSIIRPDAVIFHRDARQGLIPRQPGERRFAHSGCMGDTIAALPTIRALGGGSLVMTQKNNARILRGERYEFLRPLLEAQPYIKGVSWEEEPKDIDCDFTDFRSIYEGNVSLAETQARYLGVEISTEPWLAAPPDERTRGKIVIARSPRYHNNAFPWRQIVQENIQRIVLVGLESERRAFESIIGRYLPYIPASNALELASLIAGADLFIGNQSSPFWIAAGLGKKLVQEVYPDKPDSKIVRSNAFYWHDRYDNVALFKEIS